MWTNLDLFIFSLDGDKECSATTDLQANNCYSQGNVEGLNKFIASLTGKENPKVQ